MNQPELPTNQPASKGASDRSAQMPEVPPYLEELRDYLRRHEKPLWKWFQSEKQNERLSEAVELDLLKSTIRIAPDDQPQLYSLAQQAADSLQLDVPITIYNATQSGQRNASISVVTEHAHIVLHGDSMEHFNDSEKVALFGHELSHLLLWQIEGGDYLTVANLLVALGTCPGAKSVHQQTLRWYHQFVEIFCDRGAMIVQGEFDSVVASLIKLETGTKQVSVSSYLKQADEIFAAGGLNSDSKSVTHPELYVRTRALDLYRNTSQKDRKDCEESIQQMVCGRLSLDAMDLAQQSNAQQLTQQVLDLMLQPEWMQCEEILAHARLFFADYEVKAHRSDRIRKRIAKQVSDCADDFKTYITFLLLDLVAADRDILEAALAHAIQLADDFSIGEEFLAAATKELRLTKSRVKKIIESSSELADQAMTLASNRVGKPPARSDDNTSDDAAAGNESAERDNS